MAHDNKLFRFSVQRVRIKSGQSGTSKQCPASAWNVSLKEVAMSDRRSEKRLDVCLDAVWDGKSGNYIARVTDLSEGGCYIDTLGGASNGEILRLKLQLPDGAWLELTGAVAHQSPPLGFGMKFVDLTDAQLETLRSIISHQQTQKSPETIPTS
jgi:hypothetical protein